MTTQRKLIVAIATKLSLDGGVLSIGHITLYYELLGYVINGLYTQAYSHYGLYMGLYTPTLDTLLNEWYHEQDFSTYAPDNSDSNTKSVRTDNNCSY